MPGEKSYRRHLERSDDLITTYENTRAGFVALALEKNHRATPFVEQARALKSVAARAETPAALITMREIRPALLTAAGVSDKALGHMQQQDQEEVLRGLIRNFLEPAGASFVEELVYRFLLTRGDSLGGSMRNLGGILAQRRLSRTLIAVLTLAGISYQWLHATHHAWIRAEAHEPDVEAYLRGLSWSTDRRARTMVYNLTVPLVKNNVDLCLFDCSGNDYLSVMREAPDRYIALGELKGGIDPAGADEHWKTARTALSRIREAFAAHLFRGCRD